jgi:hypothetical protein
MGEIGREEGRIDLKKKGKIEYWEEERRGENRRDRKRRRIGLEEIRRGMRRRERDEE